MVKIKRLKMFNQVVGPLFSEMAEELSKYFPESSYLFTSNYKNNNLINKLIIKNFPLYKRSNYFSRILSWIKYSLYGLFVILNSSKNDLILITTNPPIFGIFVYPFLKIKNLKYVLVIYDIYPEVIINHGIFKNKNFIILIWNFLNKILYKNSSLIITLTESMKNHLLSKYSIPKIEVIPPWVDTVNISPIPNEQNPLAKEYIPDGKFVVMYSGNMGKTHDIISILEAAVILKDIDKIQFLLIGQGPGYEIANNFVESNELKNVNLFPFQPIYKLKYTLALASISIVSIKSGFDDFLIPSKTFFYLAAGSPLISISSSNSELSRLVLNNNIGVVVSPGESNQLAIAIQKIMNNEKAFYQMKKNSRNLVVSKFSKGNSLKKLSNIFINANLFN
tara:strand:+ start:8639 stop:9814 length:1176 start_codon:yes stop_codon:yes gene_type:complete